ncbi:MAG: 30S ribosomal protein S8 [Candidatus Latescibacteria bacterium 4484_181]|nr:MAG: 30S ribosomal protein S8 [Candidatus Latescibacteria bacterium 4484_181]RKY68238.1 MAG: 30S ribosomal protein S8 [Candidatus Latescibacterota bacterium]RKY72952.1 MAG: 30S ribosomal protein S8 [Candidatus Latescibacterota bacterium]HDN67624.1 30S ribosomal protein S8 [Bacillota bacterium]
MSMTDPIADMLTSIRNACRAKHRKVDVPASNMKQRIVDILRETNFIEDYIYIEDNRQGYLRIYLKYDAKENSFIKGIKRVSRPGLRKYVGHQNIPKVLNGLGIAIISTPRGVLTDEQARAAGVGGEVICYVW